MLVQWRSSTLLASTMRKRAQPPASTLILQVVRAQISAVRSIHSAPLGAARLVNHAPQMPSAREGPGAGHSRGSGSQSSQSRVYIPARCPMLCPSALAGARHSHRQSVARGTCRCALYFSVTSACIKCALLCFQGSYLCGACAFGYFLADNGACSRCPAVASVWDRYGTLIILLSSAIGITFLVFMLMTALITLSGGNVKGLVGVRNFFLALGWVLRLFFYRVSPRPSPRSLLLVFLFIS